MEGQQLSVDLKKTHTIGFQTSQAILLDFAAKLCPKTNVRKVVSQSKFIEQIFRQQTEQNFQIVHKLFFSKWQNK